MRESQNLSTDHESSESSSLDSRAAIKSGTVEPRMVHSCDGAEFGTFHATTKKKYDEDLLITVESDFDQRTALKRSFFELELGMESTSEVISSTIFAQIGEFTQVLATTCKHDVKIWNVLTGQLLYVLQGHLQAVSAISSCHFETEEEANRDECKVYLFTGSENGEARLWRPSLMEASETSVCGVESLAVFPKVHDKGITAITLYPDIHNDHEHIAIFVAKDKSASIWRIKEISDYMVDTTLIVHLKAIHTDLINAVSTYRDECCSDHELMVITASTDKSLKYWKIATDREYTADETEKVVPFLIKSNAHVKAVTCIASYTLTTKEAIIEYEAQADGSFQRKEIVQESYYANVLVSGSLDKTVAVRSLQNPDDLIVSMKGHGDKVNGVRVVDSRMKGSPPMIVSCSDDCTVIIWNLLDGKIIRRMRYTHKLTSITVFTTAEGFMIACTATNGRVAIWNYVHIERIRKFETAAVTAIDICYPRPGTNEKTLMVVGTIDNTCHVLDYFGDKQTESKRYLKGHTNRINAALVYSPPDPTEPPLVVTCSNDGTVRVFNLSTGRMKKVWRVDKVLTYGLAIFNPLLCGSAQGSAVESGIASGRACNLDLNQPWIVAGGLYGMLTILDLMDAARSPDLLEDAIIEESTNHAANVQAHKVFHIVRTIAVHHDRVDRNKSKVISGGYDNLTIIWDLCTMTKLAELTEHIDKVFAIAVYDPLACCDGAASLPKDNQQPLIVTGSYDKTVIIWDMDTGTKRHTLLGHGESVTDMVIYSTKENPLLATGSIDKIIIVWSLLSGERIQTLVGHTDRICFLTLYMPSAPSFGDFPTIVSGGDDRVVIIWEDVFHPQVNSFSRDNVNRAFHYDLEEEDWPMLTHLLGEGPSVLLENPQLFFFAIEHDRPDFILKFRSILRESLPFLDKHRVQIIQEDNNDAAKHEEPREIDILSYAIVFEDLVSVRAILLSWTEIMNKDIRNTLGQSLYYPGYFFPVEALQPLAKVYPLEYMHFLCAIKLVRNHASVMLDRSSSSLSAMNRQPKQQKDMHTAAKAFVLNEWDRYEIVGTNMRNGGFASTWSSYLEHRRSVSHWGRFLELLFIPYRNSPQPVTSLILPLRRTSNIHKSLATFVKVSAQLNRWDIFRSAVGDYTLKYCWKHGGEEAHFRALSFYLLIFLLFMSSVYSYHEINAQSSIDVRCFSSFMAMLTILGFFLLILSEFLQFLVQFSDVVHVKNDTSTTENKRGGSAEEDRKALRMERSTSMKRRASKTAADAAFDKSKQQARILYKPNNQYRIFREISQSQQQQQQSQPPKSSLFTLKLNVDHDEYLRANFSIENIVFYLTHDLWNVLDCSICLFGILGMLLRLVYSFQDTPTGRCFLAMTSILMWFKWLYFLRPYPWSGPLVVMIVTIAYSIRSFIFVLFLVLAGFAQAFWLLSEVDASLPFGQVTSAFYNAFLYMLGQDIQVTFDNSVSPRFTTFILSMFLITMGILMLNLLIALMGDTFAEVRSQGVAFFRNEQAAIIFEEQAWASAKELPAYLHVLKYSTDVVLLHGGDDQLASDENNQLISLVRGSIDLVKPFTPYTE